MFVNFCNSAKHYKAVITAVTLYSTGKQNSIGQFYILSVKKIVMYYVIANVEIPAITLKVQNVSVSD